MTKNSILDHLNQQLEIAAQDIARAIRDPNVSDDEILAARNRLFGLMREMELLELKAKRGIFGFLGF